MLKIRSTLGSLLSASGRQSAKEHLSRSSATKLFKWLTQFSLADGPLQSRDTEATLISRCATLFRAVLASDL
jgi:hypothetical protein